MKYMIASDLHGSAYYCEKMFEAYEREKADRLLLLGDLLYHGPRNDLPQGYEPKRAAALLNEHRKEIFCVCGNCDAQVDQMVLEFPILAEYAVFPGAKNMLFATHGHRFHEDSLPPLKEGDILLHGHTHIPGVWEKDGIYILNPGSLSLPKENSPHSYLIWEGENFCWKTIEGEEYLKWYWLEKN